MSKLLFNFEEEMDTLIIKDFDTAIDAYIATWVRGFDMEALEVSQDTNLFIKVEGEQWDGAIDYKVAEFVVRLQKAVLTVRNEQVTQKIRYNTRSVDEAGLRITVSIEKGCTLFGVDLKGWLDGMESKDKRNAFIVVAMILSVTTGIGLWKKLDADVAVARISADSALELARLEKQKEIDLKIQERLQDEDTRREASQAIDKAFKLAEQTTSHIAFLASKMQPKDTMTIDDVVITAPVAKRIFHPVTHEEELGENRHYFLDDNYVVTRIDREKDEVILQFVDKKRRFSLVWLEGPELEAFYKQCAQHKIGEMLPPIPLQVTAYFRGGVFQDGFIAGIGGKREGTLTFIEAALNSAQIREDEELASEAE